jgi:Uma2 family endonuclease
MDSIVEHVGMSLDEYMRLYDEQPFELINGERKLLMVNVAGHGEVAKLLFLALHMFVTPLKLGYVYMEQTFVLSYVSNWVTGSRKPDVSYYSAARMDAYIQANPDWKSKPYILVPDLVIEVVSPNDNLGELDDKVNLYLMDGVQIVWVFDPQKQRASISKLVDRQPFTKQETHLTPTDMLTGGDLIPGFEIQVATIFA